MPSFKQYLMNKTDSLLFFTSLRVLLDSFESYQNTLTNKNLIPDLLNFVDIRTKSNLPLTNYLKVNPTTSRVNLLTAHSAKGQEFDTVFIVHAIDGCWAAGGKTNKIGVPMNISLLPDKNEHDDLRRLFYVALTRAKSNLIITKYLTEKEGKETKSLSFLGTKNLDFQVQNIIKNNSKTSESVYNNIKFFSSHRFELSDLYKSILDNYRISPSHLNMYLDIVNDLSQNDRSGPKKFFEKIILKIPEKTFWQTAYGSAIHSVIVDFQRSIISGVRLNYNQIEQRFFEYLEAMSLDLEAMNECKRKAKDKLLICYNNLSFESKNVEMELDFRSFNIRCGNAILTGKADCLEFNDLEGVLKIIDFKTGKAPSSTDPWSKVLKSKYTRQLYFYKYLVENSNFQIKNRKWRCEVGTLLFVEEKNENPDKFEGKLDIEFKKEEMNKFENLLQAVWENIIQLKFPDIDSYANNINGLDEFIQDLVNKKF
jgi:DNA helicase II / ATP-dependent DNA helicase PcrA